MNMKQLLDQKRAFEREYNFTSPYSKQRAAINKAYNSVCFRINVARKLHIVGAS